VPSCIGRGEATSKVGCLLLLRHNLVLDLLIRGSRKNLLLHQFILPLVRTALDDLLCVGIANTRECLEVFDSGGVDVEEVGLLKVTQRLRTRAFTTSLNLAPRA
jgi:hypothetical protein